MSTTTILFSNNAQTTLAGAITNVATTALLQSGAGALFPAPAANQYFVATLTDAATGLQNEIVHITNVAGDVVTMVRAQEGTTAQAWNAGDFFSNFWTAGQARAMQQALAGQAQSANYAVDTGAANAYVVALSPPLTAAIPGMPIRIKITNPNSGASTLNAGYGAQPIINPDGTAIGSGTLSGSGDYTFQDDGAGNFQLTSASNAGLSSNGIQTTGDWKWRPTAETLAGYVKANATTIGNVSSGATQLASLTASSLYQWIWTNFSNTQCPVTGGRGVSGIADFTANKAIQVPDMRGTLGYFGMDTMGGGATTRLSSVPVTSGNATTPGSLLGENLHTLSNSELPIITPTFTGSTQTWTAAHTYNDTSGGINSSTGPGSAQTGNASTAPQTTVTPAGTISSFGGGAAHNNVPFAMVGTIYIKL